MTFKINYLQMKRNILFITVVLVLAMFAGCQKGDGDADYGYTNIYMPQATVTGGLNLNYAVPSGDGFETYNYKIDSINHKLNVILGVIRSGKQSDDGYSVSVSVNKDTTTQLITKNVITNGVLLPDASYTLPTSVSVPAGQSYSSFYLSIDAVTLKTFSGKKAAITIAISNPSNYTLYTKYSKTVVIIDVDAIKAKLK